MMTAVGESAGYPRLNELLGPILFKISLDHTGESAADISGRGSPAAGRVR
jgi:hypothetical protein